MTTWTQINAYVSILPHLPKRRRQVLECLLDHDGFTGMELSTAMGEDARNITPRLNELRTMYDAIHKGRVRDCRITGHPAETWWCGPKNSNSPHLPVRVNKDEALLKRLHFLLSYAPDLADADPTRGPIVARILGVTEKRLKDVIRKEKQRLADG